MEKLIANRLAQLAGVVMTPELEAILFGLVQSAKEGHLCTPIEDASLLPSTLAVIVDGNRLYLPKNWELETLILQKVRELLGRATIEDSARFRENLAKEKNLQEAQRKALLAAFENMFAIFTGGPGTGKTFTAGCFIRLLAPLKVVIAAPTGKAAAHLENVLQGQGSEIKCESTTLHRLLKLRPGMQRLRGDWTIDADLVVVDEASMLDCPLLLHLLNAIGPRTRLLLLGDGDQLPPVEGGGLFGEMAELFGQKLERSMRSGGGLLEFSQAILKGDLHNRDAVEWVQWKDQTECLDWLCQKIPNPIHFEEPKFHRTPFQVLCAMRQGPFGADALNREILERFQKKLRAGQWFAVPILIVQNDPKQKLYNGTAGVLVRKEPSRHAIAYFEGGKEVRESALPHYEIAFCLSVHKSQGSEYEEVALLFPPGSECFGKEALYTGVTRAKKRAHIAIDEGTLESILKVRARKRSGFSERFKTKA